MLSPRELRWVAVCILVLSSALNYLDRAILNALMPELQKTFGATREQLGIIVSAFSVVYAVSSPAMGLLVDRLGLRSGTALIVALWSAAGMATGLVGSMTGLLVCRGILGFAEAGGVPATGKGFATYLLPESRAMGTALNQVGISIGSVGAPIITEWLFPVYGWRAAFVFSGALGFAWIPVWLWSSSKALPLQAAGVRAATSLRSMLSDRRYIALVVANVLAMTIYSLWTNWTTLFLVTAYGISREQANLRFAWAPPLFATAGGLLGGWIALTLIRGGADVMRTRIRISIAAAGFAMATAAASIVPAPGLATAAICISLAATTCMSVNYYAIPLDLFGPAHAAFAVSILTGVFGLMQTVLSPLIGRWSEEFGWMPVCFATAPLPLASALILRAAFRSS